MPFWDRTTTTASGRVTAPFWPHGMTNSQPARAGVGYLMKYVSKLDTEAEFPQGLRLYGVGGLDEQARAIRGWYNLPEWAKRFHGVNELCRVGSHLVIKQTGELVPPMYARQFQPGVIVLHQLRPMPDRWHDGAYSSVSFH